MNNYFECINDQKEALKCNAQYDKAYSRLGASYTALNQTKEAIKAYEDCLAVNPADSTAKQELEKLRKPQTGGMGGLDEIDAHSGIPAPGGAPTNFMDMMNNPHFMEMAANMMENNPQLMQMAQQVAQNPELMRQFFGGNMPDLSQMGFPPNQ